MLEVWQGVLETQLHSIFPLHNIINNSKRDVAISDPQTGKYLEVDLWIPELSLCFEFQDDYHYKPTWYHQRPLSLVKQKDDVKRNLLLERGETVIVVPYWWDGTSSSLQGTINFACPNLMSFASDTQIPCNPPAAALPGYKQLMLASFPDSTVPLDRSIWWVGEKWDGIRCYWNVAEGHLYSRHNLELEIDPAVDRELGGVMLDGELWCGRGFFYESQQYIISDWMRLDASYMRLMCFDEASPQLHQKTFEERYSFLLSNLPRSHPFVIIAPRFLCANETVIVATLQSVIQGGGEGLILRQPQSHYIPGRSASLLKIKASKSDQEALVLNVDHNYISLQLTNGNVFETPIGSCVMPQIPVRGDIVTISFDFSKGPGSQSLNSTEKDEDFATKNPTNLIIHRIRSDLTWDDITLYSLFPVRVFTNERYQSFDSMKRPDTKEVIQGPKHIDSPVVHKWAHLPDRRAYFDHFAASTGNDPLNPSFWYDVKTPDLVKHNSGIAGILKYYKSVPNALMQLYPEIGLQKSNFTVDIWKREASRRIFFDGFAKSKGADPRNPNFWYTILVQDLTKYYQKGLSGILQYYGNSLTNALLQLYPDIGLQKSKFSGKLWKRESKRREFFDSFAHSRGAHPRDPNFWYNTTVQELTKYYRKGLSGILAYHGGSFTNAIMQLYPDIGFEKSDFSVLWKRENSRREFFDSFAASKGADPRNPTFWYSVKTSELLTFNSGYKRIARYYDRKLSNALMLLYPNIGLELSKFKEYHPTNWKSEVKRKAYFDSFAAAKGKNALDPNFWYTVTKGDLMKYNQGYQTICKYHGGELSTTLMELYPNIELQTTKFKAK